MMHLIFHFCSSSMLGWCTFFRGLLIIPFIFGDYWLSQLRYRHVKQINLEFAQDIEDKHLDLAKTKVILLTINKPFLDPIWSWNLAIFSLQSQNWFVFLNFIVWSFEWNSMWILQCLDSLQELESLNLNVCQKISDRGVETITSSCPKLKVFSIYWNVRYFECLLDLYIFCTILWI